MFHKVVHCDEPEKPVYLKDWGEYNTLPNPWRPCTVDDYLHIASMYTPEFIEYRQLHGMKEFPQCRECTIYYWHSHAIAVVYPNKWRCGKENESSIVYEEPVLYFHIGCDHKLRELGREECHKRGIDHFGMHWHVTECPECGYTNSYDSSG